MLLISRKLDRHSKADLETYFQSEETQSEMGIKYELHQAQFVQMADSAIRADSTIKERDKSVLSLPSYAA